MPSSHHPSPVRGVGGTSGPTGTVRQVGSTDIAALFTPEIPEDLINDDDNTDNEEEGERALMMEQNGKGGYSCSTDVPAIQSHSSSTACSSPSSHSQSASSPESPIFLSPLPGHPGLDTEVAQHVAGGTGSPGAQCGSGEDAGYESGCSPQSATSFNHSPISQQDQGIDITDNDLAYVQNAHNNLVGGLATDSPVSVMDTGVSDSLDFMSGSDYDYNSRSFSDTALLQDSAAGGGDILDELLGLCDDPGSMVGQSSEAAMTDVQFVAEDKDVLCVPSGNVGIENIIGESSPATMAGVVECVSSVQAASSNLSPTTMHYSPPKQNSPPKMGGKSLLRSLFDMAEGDIRPPPISLSRHPDSTTQTTSTAAMLNGRCGLNSPSYGPSFPMSPQCGVAVGGDDGDRLLRTPANSEIPQDLSEFALQYLEPVTNLDCELMDFDEHELGSMASELHQIVTQALGMPGQSGLNGSNPVAARNSVNGQGDSSSAQYALSENSSKRTTLCSSQNNKNWRKSTGQIQGITSSQLDHEYFQHPPRVDLSDKNNSKTSGSSQRRSSCDCMCAPSSTTSMSELEKRLRGISSNPRVHHQTPSSSKPLLQMFLTGEMSKDQYQQMEQARRYKHKESCVALTSTG